jgi:hypothetical protein
MEVPDMTNKELVRKLECAFQEYRVELNAIEARVLSAYSDLDALCVKADNVATMLDMLRNARNDLTLVHQKDMWRPWEDIQHKWRCDSKVSSSAAPDAVDGDTTGSEQTRDYVRGE